MTESIDVTTMDADQLVSRLETERGWFEEWRTPGDFAWRHNQVQSIVKSEFYFNRNESKWLREAWVLNEYAEITTPSMIRLNRLDPPDAYVKLERDIVPIEITEIIEPGRKRGLEYRSAAKIEDDPVEDWIERAEAILPSLNQRIQEKKLRNYPSDTELLIYLNISEWGIRQREIESEIRSELDRPIKPFAAIHVLWKEKIFSSNGVARVHPDFTTPQDFRGDD